VIPRLIEKQVEGKDCNEKNLLALTVGLMIGLAGFQWPMR